MPDDDLIVWLLKKGVSEKAMMHPWCIGGGRVHFEGHHFNIDPNGDRVIMFRAQDCGITTDLIAWELRTNKLASWAGAAACLGDVDDVFNPGTYFAGGALRIHRTPLEWLKVNREGIVILRPELSYIYLRRCRRLWVPDMQLATGVRRWLQPPRSHVEIIVADTGRIVT